MKRLSFALLTTLFGFQPVHAESSGLRFLSPETLIEDLRLQNEKGIADYLEKNFIIKDKVIECLSGPLADHGLVCEFKAQLKGVETGDINIKLSRKEGDDRLQIHWADAVAEPLVDSPDYNGR